MVCVRIISSNKALVSCYDFLFAVQTTSPALAPNPNPNAMPSVSAQDSVPPINCPFNTTDHMCTGNALMCQSKQGKPFTHYTPLIYSMYLQYSKARHTKALHKISVIT